MKIWAWAALLATSHVLAQTPERMVVLDVAAADTLQVLGNADKIIALPKASLPAYLSPLLSAHTVDTGPQSKLAYSHLRQIKPDVIYAPKLAPATQASLQQIAPTQVLSFSPNSYWQDVERNTLAVASNATTQNLAKQRLHGLQQQINALQQRIDDDNRSLLVLEHQQGHYRWRPQAAYQGLLYGVLHIKRPVNLPTQEQEVTLEQLQTWQPESLWVIDVSGAQQRQPVDMSVLETAARGTPAAQQQRIKMLQAEHWPSVAVGLQGLQLQLDEVAREW